MQFSHWMPNLNLRMAASIQFVGDVLPLPPKSSRIVCATRTPRFQNYLDLEQQRQMIYTLAIIDVILFGDRAHGPRVCATTTYSSRFATYQLQTPTP